ncbi:unnamed protein product, partial [Meganyctiphanes norvegica]
VFVIIGSYIGLFLNIRGTRARTTLQSDRDTAFALRFLFIVLTDCVCWLPIVIVKISAMANVETPPNVYAYLVVLVLPINSAINPILYTFSTSYFEGKIQSMFSSFCKRTWRWSDADSQSIRESTSKLNWSKDIHSFEKKRPTFIHRNKDSFESDKSSLPGWIPYQPSSIFNQSMCPFIKRKKKNDSSKEKYYEHPNKQVHNNISINSISKQCQNKVSFIEENTK